VRQHIEGYRTIEIGAGNGCLGRSLGISSTDSFIQNSRDIQLLYQNLKQPPVKYGADVIKCEALRAVKVFGAECAVGSWVTHKYKPHLGSGFFGGVDEAILSKRLKRYVFVGNLHTHQEKELVRYCVPREYRADWLVSRSMHRRENMIWIFDFEK